MIHDSMSAVQAYEITAVISQKVCTQWSAAVWLAAQAATTACPVHHHLLYSWDSVVIISNRENVRKVHIAKYPVSEICIYYLLVQTTYQIA